MTAVKLKRYTLWWALINANINVFGFRWDDAAFLKINKNYYRVLLYIWTCSNLAAHHYAQNNCLLICILWILRPFNYMCYFLIQVTVQSKLVWERWSNKEWLALERVGGMALFLQLGGFSVHTLLEKTSEKVMVELSPSLQGLKTNIQRTGHIYQCKQMCKE